MPFAELSNGTFHYKLVGQGPPVVFISGYTGDHSLWLRIADQMKENFQMLLFDNQGIGLTKDKGKPLSVEMMADDVIELADSLKLKNPHIVGQSMGGTIVQNIGARYGKKVGELAILASSAKWRYSMILAVKSILNLIKNGSDFDTVFEVSTPWFFGDEFLEDESRVQQLKETMKNNPNPQSLINMDRQFKALEQFDGRKALPSIHNPTLVLFANEDVIALPQESAFLASKIPNSKLEECHCGHSMNLEIPDQIAEILLHFLP